MIFWFEIFFLALLGLAFVAIGFTSIVVLVRLFRGQRKRCLTPSSTNDDWSRGTQRFPSTRVSSS